jgi:hypothetical protein
MLGGSAPRPARPKLASTLGAATALATRRRCCPPTSPTQPDHPPSELTEARRRTRRDSSSSPRRDRRRFGVSSHRMCRPMRMRMSLPVKVGPWIQPVEPRVPARAQPVFEHGPCDPGCGGQRGCRDDLPVRGPRRSRASLRSATAHAVTQRIFTEARASHRQPVPAATWSSWN